jgi:hypothetical protein
MRGLVRTDVGGVLIDAQCDAGTTPRTQREHMAVALRVVLAHVGAIVHKRRREAPHIALGRPRSLSHHVFASGAVRGAVAARVPIVVSEERLRGARAVPSQRAVATGARGADVLVATPHLAADTHRRRERPFRVVTPPRAAREVRHVHRRRTVDDRDGPRPTLEGHTPCHTVCSAGWLNGASGRVCAPPDRELAEWACARPRASATRVRLAVFG